MPVIPVTWEAKIGESWFNISQAGLKVKATLSQRTTQVK
jgi:hypothetical protein